MEITSLLSRHGREIPERRAEQVHLAHYPVRSAGQLASKAVLGALGDSSVQNSLINSPGIGAR